MAAARLLLALLLAAGASAAAAAAAAGEAPAAAAPQHAPVARRLQGAELPLPPPPPPASQQLLPGPDNVSGGSEGAAPPWSPPPGGPPAELLAAVAARRLVVYKRTAVAAAAAAAARGGSSIITRGAGGGGGFARPPGAAAALARRGTAPVASAHFTNGWTLDVLQSPEDAEALLADPRAAAEIDYIVPDGISNLVGLSGGGGGGRSLLGSSTAGASGGNDGGSTSSGGDSGSRLSAPGRGDTQQLANEGSSSGVTGSRLSAPGDKRRLATKGGAWQGVSGDGSSGSGAGGVTGSRLSAPGDKRRLANKGGACGGRVTERQPRSWGLDRIDQLGSGLDRAWRRPAAFDGGGVDVYVLDTGIRATHVEFSPPGRAQLLKTFFPNDTAPGGDGRGHGTHVAATIGGATAGIARGSNIYAIAALNSAGFGADSVTIEALAFAMQRAAAAGRRAVINLSLESAQSAAVDAAVQAVWDSGCCIVVAAAGNRNQDVARWSPAGAAAAVTVGATNEGRDLKAEYSNWGGGVDLWAPGSGIASAGAANDTAYVIDSGTSMAAPHVAGWLAVLWSADPAASSQTIVNRLLKSAVRRVRHGRKGTTKALLHARLTRADCPP